MTAAYMTRCWYLTFWGEPRGHAADKEHPPHESGPRILVPLYILSGLAIVGGFANLPALSWLPAEWTLRFEHYFEPKGALLPVWPQLLRAPGVQHLDRARSPASPAWSAWAWPGSGTSGASARTASPSGAGWPGPGTSVLVQKYYLDWLYTDVIVHAVKGPIARAAYWFNQKGIDGVINGAGAGAVRSGQFVYDKIDQGMVDTLVDGSGAAAEGSGQVLRFMQTGRVQQYAALLFAATAVLAAIFIIVI